MNFNEVFLAIFSFGLSISIVLIVVCIGKGFFPFVQSHNEFSSIINIRIISHLQGGI